MSIADLYTDVKKLDVTRDDTFLNNNVYRKAYKRKGNF